MTDKDESRKTAKEEEEVGDFDFTEPEVDTGRKEKICIRTSLNHWS